MDMNEEERVDDLPAAKEEREIIYDMTSVKEAAQLLRVSESTVWRWADQNIVPAYRVGRKRVMFRRSDLQNLLNRVRKRKEPMTTKERLRLFSMVEGGTSGRTDLVRRAKSLQADIVARRGGVLSASWEDINDSRDERSADL